MYNFVMTYMYNVLSDYTWKKWLHGTNSMGYQKNGKNPKEYANCNFWLLAFEIYFKYIYTYISGDNQIVS